MQANIPAEAFSGYLAPAQATTPTWTWQADHVRQPASLMKLLTTYIALQHLGRQYRWETPIYTNGQLQGNRWNGTVYLVGQGDPTLTRERLWSWLFQWRAQGIREWGGLVVIDRRWLADPLGDPYAFDGAGMRPYNVVADALPLQFNAWRFTFIPSENGALRVLSDPMPNERWRFHSTVQGSHAACTRDWDDALSLQVRADELHLSGQYPLACGQRDWHVSPLSATEWTTHYLAALWESMGGVWQAQVRDGNLPQDVTKPDLRLRSPPLAEVVRDINKFSNNLMARQLFLSLAPPPVSHARAAQVAHAWLDTHGLHFPELVLENGAGLSRREQITPRHLAQLLHHAWGSAVMPELLASLPIAGQDGTLKHRLSGQENSELRLKTGVLTNVRGLAGYLHDSQGRWWVVVGLVNHTDAARANPVLEAFMQWAKQMATQTAGEFPP